MSDSALRAKLFEMFETFIENAEFLEDDLFDLEVDVVKEIVDAKYRHLNLLPEEPETEIPPVNMVLLEAVESHVGEDLSDLEAISLAPSSETDSLLNKLSHRVLDRACSVLERIKPHTTEVEEASH